MTTTGNNMNKHKRGIIKTKTDLSPVTTTLRVEIKMKEMKEDADLCDSRCIPNYFIIVNSFNQKYFSGDFYVLYGYSVSLFLHIVIACRVGTKVLLFGLN